MFYRYEELGYYDVPALLSLLSYDFTTTEQYEKIKKFGNDLKQPSTSINEALQTMEYNFKWNRANIPVIMNFIKQFMSD